MLISEIYELVNYISNKHQSGEALKINRFNQLIEIFNRDFFKKKIEEFEVFRKRGSPPPEQAYFNTKLLRELKRIQTVAVGGDKRINTVADLTYEFAYLIGIVGYFGGRRRTVDLITDEEYQDRWEDSILNYENVPFVTIAGNNIYFSWGGSVNPVEVTYYSFPADPLCDYYIDVNGVMQFLSAGESHVWATGEIDSSGTTHTLGDPNYNSQTVELVYNEDKHFEFLLNLLSICGIKLEKQLVTQYAEMAKAEERAQ